MEINSFILMYYYPVLIAFMISVVMSLFILPQIIEVAFQKRLFDEPDARKIHKAEIPRLGGFSFLPIIIFSMGFTVALGFVFDSLIVYSNLGWMVPKLFMFFCGLILLYLMGLKDDLTELQYRVKFVVQFIAASFIPLSGFWVDNLYGIFGIYEIPAAVGIPFTVLLFIFIINAVNLIDGIDGLASGLMGLSFLALGVVFLHNNAWVLGMIAFSSLGCLFVFFYYNVFGRPEYHTKIFMGDTGSLTMGYILAFLFVCLISNFSVDTVYSETAVLLAYSTCIVPTFDVLRVMLVRRMNGKNMFKPDKNHIHHVFMRIGYSPRASMIRILMLSVFFCVTNIALIQFINITFVFIINVITWISFNIYLNYKLKNSFLVYEESRS